MKDAIQRHWTSYFYSGSIALIISWVMATILSGCHIGNYESPAPTSNVSFYATDPQTFTVTTVQTNGTAQSNKSVQPGLDNLPTDLSGTFTDPVEVLQLDSSTGQSGAFPPTANPSGTYFPLTIDSNNVVSSNSNSRLSAFWPNSDGSANTTCEMATIYSLDGNVGGLGSTPSTEPSAAGDVNLSGRLQFQITYQIVFQGTGCSTVLTAVSSCYQAIANCPTTSSMNQAEWSQNVHGLYDNYIVQWGAMQISDIPNTYTMGYQATYQ